MVCPVHFNAHDRLTNSHNNVGRTALHYAAMNGFAETCRRLLDVGLSSATLDVDNYTPLMYALLDGNCGVSSSFARRPQCRYRGPGCIKRSYPTDDGMPCGAYKCCEVIARPQSQKRPEYEWRISDTHRCSGGPR